MNITQEEFEIFYNILQKKKMLSSFISDTKSFLNSIKTLCTELNIEYTDKIDNLITELSTIKTNIGE